MWSTLAALKRNWAQYFVSQSSGFLILLLTYFAALIVVTGLTNLQRLVDRWTEVGQVSIHLVSSPGLAEQEALRKHLQSDSFVGGVENVSADQAVESLRKRFTQVGAQFRLDDLKPFAHESLRVHLTQAASKGDLDTWVGELVNRFSIIADIKYGKNWLARYLSLLQAAQFIGWTLLALFLICAMVISNSVIKTVVFDRRDEIEVLDFIGADDRQIYMPQILSTFLISFFAFLGAFALTLAGVALLNDHLLQGLLQGSLILASVPTVLMLFGLSLMASVLSAYATVRGLLPRLTELNNREGAH